LADFDRLLTGVDNFGWYGAPLVKRAEAVKRTRKRRAGTIVRSSNSMRI
jgi:hypothetical protein